MRGTASEVVGMMAETRFIKTVSERRTVTSEKGGRAVPGRNSSVLGTQRWALHCISSVQFKVVKSCICTTQGRAGLPMSSTASEVVGMMAEMRFIKRLARGGW